MFTKEQKQAYFKSLRDRWQEAKMLAETEKWKAAFNEAVASGVSCTPTSFVLVKLNKNI